MARNQINFNAGIGILATTGDVVSGAQTITITNSAVTNFDAYGINLAGASPLALTMKSNTINSNTAGATGVIIGSGFTGTVSGTVVSNMINTTIGLWLEGASVTASNNPIRGMVSLLSGSNTLTGNHINASTAQNGIGVRLIGAGTNVVELNNIVNATTAISGCGNIGAGSSPASGNTVMHNTIINSTVGIYVPYGNTIVPNYFELVPTAVQPCL